MQVIVSTGPVLEVSCAIIESARTSRMVTSRSLPTHTLCVKRMHTRTTWCSGAYKQCQTVNLMMNLTACHDPLVTGDMLKQCAQ